MYRLVVIASVFAAACAQMLLKKGALERYSSFWRQYINIWVIGGYAIMMASLLLNIFALNHGVMVKEISIIESLSYMFVPMLSFLFFKERISLQKAGAVMIIMIGVIVFFLPRLSL